MNESQRRQIQAAVKESEAKSYCIDARGQHSMVYKSNLGDHSYAGVSDQRVDSMPMYQKD